MCRLIGFFGMDDFSVIVAWVGRRALYRCDQVYISAFGAWRQSCQECCMILVESTNRSFGSDIVSCGLCFAMKTSNFNEFPHG